MRPRMDRSCSEIPKWQRCAPREGSPTVPKVGMRALGFGAAEAIAWQGGPHRAYPLSFSISPLPSRATISPMEIHPATGPTPEDRGRSGAKGYHIDGHRFDTPRTGQEGKGPSRRVPGLELPASRETHRPGLYGGC